jgi:hypothetical protein
MKPSFKLMLAAATAVLAIAACKKPDAPAPNAPAEPQAAQTSVTESANGKSTTFAPPAAEPQEPAATQAPKPAQ